MSKPEAVSEGPKYERFLDCVHCGLCTAACPTYLETGDENNSPRGRIHLMRAVTDGRIELDEHVESHLDLCLDCRACETACPSGVEYGRLIEPFRASQGHKMGVLERLLINRVFPSKRLLPISLSLARLSQRSGLDWLLQSSGALRLLPSVLQRMHRVLPLLPHPGGRHPTVALQSGERRARVGLFLGCVADAMFRPLHHATRDVLTANGCEVVTPSDQVCCGAIPYHGGDPQGTLAYVKKNLAAFEAANVDAVVINVAGCGALWKELPEIVRELAPDDSELQRRCDTLAPKIRDINEYLVEIGITAPNSTLELTVVYHAACHLQHAQKVRDAPLKILEMIPGLKVLIPNELDICCGAAGSYNLTQPEMASRLGRRKVDHLIAANAGQVPDAIASANIGCSLQIAAEFRDRGTPVPLQHPVELLATAYRTAQPH